MITLRRSISLTVSLSIFASWLLCGVLFAQNSSSQLGTPDGVWSGTATYNGQQVPLRLEIAGNGDQVQGALINGKERSPSSSGSYSNGYLVLRFDYYANIIDATLKDGTLTGAFSGHSRSIPITATLNAKPPYPSANPPRIAACSCLRDLVSAFASDKPNHDL